MREEAVATRVCNHLQTSGPQPWQPGKIYCGDGQKTKNSCANFTEPHYEKCLSSASPLSVRTPLSTVDRVALADMVPVTTHQAKSLWPKVLRFGLIAQACH